MKTTKKVMLLLASVLILASCKKKDTTEYLPKDQYKSPVRSVASIYFPVTGGAATAYIEALGNGNLVSTTIKHVGDEENYQIPATIKAKTWCLNGVVFSTSVKGTIITVEASRPDGGSGNVFPSQDPYILVVVTQPF